MMLMPHHWYGAAVPAAEVPTVYFPRRPGEPPEPVPYVLTDSDLIRFTRLDETGSAKPELTLRYYRQKALLPATQIGRCNRYTLPDVLAFLEKLKDWNPK